MKRPLVQWLGLVFLLAFGYWGWRPAPDPLVRQWFMLPASPGRTIPGTVLFSRAAQPHPVVIYTHGFGGSLAKDEPMLRRLGDLGFAAVDLEYDQTNHALFQADMGALLAYLNRQPWANTKAMAWVGVSLGANHFLDYALRHPEQQPQFLGLLSSHYILARPHRDEFKQLHGPVLLLHGEQDDWFRWGDTEKLYQELTSEGVPAEIKVFPGLGHGLEPDLGVIIRNLGEFWLNEFNGTNWWRNYHPVAAAGGHRLGWFGWLPAIIWVLAWMIRWPSGKRETPAPKWPPGLRVFAGLMAAWVLGISFIYIITPQLPINHWTLAMAGKTIVTPEERTDFDYLAGQTNWQGQAVNRCFEQIKWAGCVQRHFNWRGNEAVYREFCLSPFITGAPGESASWRPEFWMEFYPGLENETNAVAAAGVVVRRLRERVIVVSAPELPEEVATIWQTRVTDLAGFEITYVAALRAVGIPARLNADHQAELWNGTDWETAPSPALMGW